MTFPLRCLIEPHLPLEIRQSACIMKVTSASLRIYTSVPMFWDARNKCVVLISQTPFPRSGDVIHPQLWESGSGDETKDNRRRSNAMFHSKKTRRITLWFSNWFVTYILYQICWHSVPECKWQINWKITKWFDFPVGMYFVFEVWIRCWIAYLYRKIWW